MGPRSGSGGETIARRLDELLTEVQRLSRRLQRSIEMPRTPAGLSAGLADLLGGLERGGPQTVPQMARARAVSRQHVQTLVNELLAGGYVELIENPAHARSHLVRPTPRGEKALARIRRRERALYREWGRGTTPRRLRAAADLLRSVRESMEGPGPPPRRVKRRKG